MIRAAGRLLVALAATGGSVLLAPGASAVDVTLPPVPVTVPPVPVTVPPVETVVAPSPVTVPQVPVTLPSVSPTVPPVGIPPVTVPAVTVPQVTAPTATIPSPSEAPLPEPSVSADEPPATDDTSARASAGPVAPQSTSAQQTTGAAPPASATGVAPAGTTASRPRPPLTLATATRRATGSFAVPLLMIAAVGAYVLVRAALDRRDARLASVQSLDRWMPFR